VTAGFEQAPDATPLGRDDLLGLKLPWVVTQADLNVAEEANILDAISWTRRRRRTPLLDRTFVLALHRRMFGDVWAWAGTWRQRETNIGVIPNIIPVRVESLVQDARHWIDHSVFDTDELAVRFHHQLVFIHPFANGNGRHSRLMADLLIEQLGGPAFSWGGHNLTNPTETRRSYIRALKAADAGDIAPLLGFARS
jgi:Fic-DOC domain mobile mystery protein B